MGINDYLADELVAERAEKGKKISLEMAKLVVLVRTYDAFARDFRKVNPTMSAKKIAATLKVSVRFVEITLARYGLSGMETFPAGLEEQIAEMKEREGGSGK